MGQLEDHWNQMYSKPVSDPKDIEMMRKFKHEEFTLDKEYYEDIYQLYKKYLKPDQRDYTTECEGCSSSIYLMFNHCKNRLILPNEEFYQETLDVLQELKKEKK